MSKDEDNEKKPNWWQKWGIPLLMGFVILLFLGGAIVVSMLDPNPTQTPSIYKDRAANIDTTQYPYVRKPYKSNFGADAVTIKPEWGNI
jgi:hypothetical protein